MLGLLYWFSKADNLNKVKGVVELLRYSCMLTLAAKHKYTLVRTLLIFGRDVSVVTGLGLKFTLPTKQYIRDFSKKVFFDQVMLVPFDLSEIEKNWGSAVSIVRHFLKKCIIIDCERTNVGIRQVIRLNQQVVRGFVDFMEKSRLGLKKEQVPLCLVHYKVLNLFNFLVIDYEYLKKIINAFVIKNYKRVS